VNRRGSEWVQIFGISLFLLFVVLTLVLLSLNKSALADERPQTQLDLLDHKANVLLINLLRNPTSDGTLSDTIILKRSDEEIAKIINERMPKDIYYELYIQWGDHTLYVRNQDIREMGKVRKRMENDYERQPIGTGTALLPGNPNAKLKIFIADEAFPQAYLEVNKQSMLKKFEYEATKDSVDEQTLEVDGLIEKTLQVLTKVD
jgi:hypothetical protein